MKKSKQAKGREMLLLLDGYNIFFKLVSSSINDKSSNEEFLSRREKFITTLSQYFLKRKTKARCFFDGGNKNAFFDGSTIFGDYFQIIFTGTKSADEAIIEFIKQEQKPETLTIITEDREILRIARAYKCRIKHTREFITEVPALTEKQGTFSGTNIKDKSKERKRKIDKTMKSKLDFKEIEDEFRNIDIADIYKELEEEDGICYY